MATRRNRRTNDQLFEESLFNNNEDYNNFFNRLYDLAIGRFKIENLPKEIYEPFVIRSLIANNEVLFFYDDTLKQYICYPYIMKGGLNIYNQPTQRTVVAPNGYTRTDLDEKNSVIIKLNNSGTTMLPIIKQYARKLYLISRIIDINVNAQKTPVVITCDENERLTFENLYRDYVGNVPFIKGNKGLDLNNITTLRTDAPIVFNQLYDLQEKLWSEYLTFLGIPNIVEKKERLISDEVRRGMGGVIVARNNIINAVQRGLDECNEMFNLNMTVLFCDTSNDYDDSVNDGGICDEVGGDYE